jgi:hypothetical protein
VSVKKVDPGLLATMQDRGGTWAAYQNDVMDSHGGGDRQYMKVGEGCTHAEPPPHMPDTQYGMGWKFRFKGFVNLETGEIDE